MNSVIRQILLLATSIVLIIFSTINSYANTFGQSCSMLPMSDSDGYLAENTAYGYIQKNLDMKTHVANACDADANGSEFKFCIRNQPGDANICTPVTMSIGDNASLGSLSSNPDIGGRQSLANINLSVEVISSEVCLMMPTSRGVFPLICRNKEAAAPAEEIVGEICRTIGKSCYSETSKSQSLLSFSGLTIHCLRDTLNKIFYLGNECPVSDDDVTLTILRPFPAFQDAMKMAVRGALILYIMIYGFKIVMNKEQAELDKIALFVIKFLFVVYFSVGIGTKTLENGKEVSHNGMTELALPMLVEMTSNFTEMVFLAGGSQGLCSFDSNKYQSGYSFYKIWDAIDCRVGYYLGMQAIYNIGTIFSDLNSNSSGSGNSIYTEDVRNENGYNVLNSVGSFSLFAVMMAFFLSGNIIIVIFGLIFVIVFLSVLLYFVTTYLVCMVTLYVMAYISPIFIPMVLFERTKGYFDSWLRIVVSCTLQPAIIGAFIALLLTMYDSAIYGNCEFQRHDYSVSEFNFSTFELRLPDQEIEKCESSLGYKLLQYYIGEGWEEKSLIIFSVTNLRDRLNILPSLLYVIIYVFIFYFFIKLVNEFASDLTGGPSMATVTTSPTLLMDKAMNVASYAMLGKQNNNYSASRNNNNNKNTGSEEKTSRDTSSTSGLSGSNMRNGGNSGSKSGPKELGSGQNRAQDTVFTGGGGGNAG